MPGALAPAAAITAVAALAGLIGAPAPVCTTTGSWSSVSTDGTISGHPARVWASIDPGQSAA